MGLSFPVLDAPSEALADTSITLLDDSSSVSSSAFLSTSLPTFLFASEPSPQLAVASTSSPLVVVSQPTAVLTLSLLVSMASVPIPVRTSGPMPSSAFALPWAIALTFAPTRSRVLMPDPALLSHSPVTSSSTSFMLD